MNASARKTIERRLDAASHACDLSNTQLTELRRSVLGLVLQAERPLTAYQLLDRLKETRKGAMPPTVYRALDFLIENKLVHKVESLNAFVACGAGHHEHAIQFLICRTCFQVAELEDLRISRALNQVTREKGFKPDSTIVEIEGICAACDDVSKQRK